MTVEQQKEITKISKKFARGIGKINGSGFLVVDPLSGYLSAIGYKNQLFQLPANKIHCLVLIIRFEDGSQFIPAGRDLKLVHREYKNWMWL